jgi:hypothetical protein
MFHNNCNKQETLHGARCLGLTSIGIGLCELAAPSAVQSVLGLNDNQSHRGILRVLGVREVMHGLGIIRESRINKKLSAGVWSRVAGDVLDGALLGMAATKTKRPLSFALVAGVVTAIALADCYYACAVDRHRST